MTTTLSQAKIVTKSSETTSTPITLDIQIFTPVYGEEANRQPDRLTGPNTFRLSGGKIEVDISLLRGSPRQWVDCSDIVTLEGWDFLMEKFTQIADRLQIPRPTPSQSKTDTVKPNPDCVVETYKGCEGFTLMTCPDCGKPIYRTTHTFLGRNAYQNKKDEGCQELAPLENGCDCDPGA